MRRKAPGSAFGWARAGNAAVEFCLILPVMLAIFGGMVEFGRAFQAYGAVNRLATRYALAWADCSDKVSGTCTTELGNYTTSAALQNVAPQLTTSAITLRMIQVTTDAAGNATVTAAYPTGTTTLTAAELAAVQGVVPAAQAGVAIVVTVGYVHQVVLFQQLMSPFLGTSRTISYTVAQLKS